METKDPVDVLRESENGIVPQEKWLATILARIAELTNPGVFILVVNDTESGYRNISFHKSGFTKNHKDIEDALLSYIAQNINIVDIIERRRLLEDIGAKTIDRKVGKEDDIVSVIGPGEDLEV